MHSALNRVQSVFGFFTTVAFVLGCFIAATDFYAARAPSGELSVQSLQVVKGRPHYYSSKKEEYSVIRFNLQADLSDLFTWNTKQVFVYVTAEWPNPGAATNATNEAVIWDSIITNPSADHLQNIGPATMKKLVKSAQGKTVARNRGVLSLKNQKPKYQITHPSGKMAELKNVKLRLHYNVQPWFGILTWNQDNEYGFWKAMKNGVSPLFDLPPIKAKKADQKKKN